MGLGYTGLGLGLGFTGLGLGSGSVVRVLVAIISCRLARARTAPLSVKPHGISPCGW